VEFEWVGEGDEDIVGYREGGSLFAEQHDLFACMLMIMEPFSWTSAGRGQRGLCLLLSWGASLANVEAACGPRREPDERGERTTMRTVFLVTGSRADTRRVSRRNREKRRAVPVSWSGMGIGSKMVFAVA